jgi:thiamine-monophosphate kinase
MNEFDLIAKYFSRRSFRGDVLLGVGDDAAVVSVPDNRRLVAAVDTIVEGVHFLSNADAADVGYRALAVNLSDMAAMGATPAWMTLSLSLPRADEHWLAKFAEGLYHLADRYNVALIGGDTVRGSLSITVQILGLVETDCWLTRNGAQVGDTIFISGAPGEAAAGLAVIQRLLSETDSTRHLVQRFLRPEARVDLGRALRTCANAAIDVSDGLLSDLGHICEMSRCGAHIDLEALPISSALRATFGASECERLALNGGDDYELLFTVAPDRLLAVEAAIASGVRCTPIGRIVEGAGVLCYRGGEAVRIEPRGYDHFS